LRSPREGYDSRHHHANGGAQGVRPGKILYAHYDPFTVSLTHPDALIALSSGRADITAHFASPSFHQRERKLADMRTIMTSNEVMGEPSTFTMLYATSRFHDANPKAVAAFLQAPEQAIASINADKRAAAQTFIDLKAQACPSPRFWRS